MSTHFLFLSMSYRHLKTLHLVKAESVSMVLKQPSVAK